uniref:Rho-GAP domain-containing protein n=1 Tax=Mola mola TaxID=94237 RepID=A0A3Q4AIT5_MOLML
MSKRKVLIRGSVSLSGLVGTGSRIHVADLEEIIVFLTSEELFSPRLCRMLSSSNTTSIPTSSTPPPLPQLVTSDPHQITMETYWREVRSIEEEKEGEEDDEAERKSVDEVELEEAWLVEAGLSSLVTGSSSEEDTPPAAEALLFTLTRQQATTVRNRVDNYNQTLKTRNRQPIRDVRDIFTEASPVWPSASASQQITLSPSLDHLPEHSSSLTNTHSPPGSQSRQADWLLRDYPYSEGVAEHKQGGTCWDCLRSCVHMQSGLLSPAPGLTRADDLSSRDLVRLGFISHIELSTFMLTLGVQAKRNRLPRLRTQDNGVFGVPLISLLENDRKRFPGVKVPVVLQKLLCILETDLQTEGILRVPGSAARLKFLRRELDRCCGGFDWSAVRQVDAAGLLKLFIRELPTPLLTHTHLCTYRISSVVHQLQALQLLTLLLPEAHRETLRALLLFLHKVVCHQDQNKMSLWNVSMVMSPNLFSCHCRGNKASVAKKQEEMDEAVGGAYLIRLMITHQELLWTVRHMNQASNQKQLGLTKTTRRLLRRKNIKNDGNQITELCEGVIRVHAPLHTKVSMAIQLDGQTRAKDVTVRFERDNNPVQRLYEVGGNITERRLHPECILLDVYRVNPHCDWLIKP